MGAGVSGKLEEKFPLDPRGLQEATNRCAYEISVDLADAPPPHHFHSERIAREVVMAYLRAQEVPEERPCRGCGQSSFRALQKGSPVRLAVVFCSETCFDMGNRPDPARRA
jgi:hypothetical protein